MGGRSEGTAVRVGALVLGVFSVAGFVLALASPSVNDDRGVAATAARTFASSTPATGAPRATPPRVEAVVVDEPAPTPPPAPEVLPADPSPAPPNPASDAVTAAPEAPPGDAEVVIAAPVLSARISPATASEAPTPVGLVGSLLAPVLTAPPLSLPLPLLGAG